MLRNGDVIELPGSRFVVTLAPANPAEDSLEMEITLEAGALDDLRHGRIEGSAVLVPPNAR